MEPRYKQSEVTAFQGDVNPGYARLDAPVQKVRESGVGGELDEIRQAVHQHNETLAQLVIRISPVLLDVPPTGADAANRTPDRNLSGVGESIRNIRREIEQQTALMRDVIRRVDL